MCTEKRCDMCNEKRRLRFYRKGKLEPDLSNINLRC